MAPPPRLRSGDCGVSNPPAVNIIDDPNASTYWRHAVQLLLFVSRLLSVPKDFRAEPVDSQVEERMPEGVRVKKWGERGEKDVDIVGWAGRWERGWEIVDWRDIGAVIISYLKKEGFWGGRRE